MLSRVKKSILIVALLAVLAIGLGASTFAAGGQSRVTICHHAGHRYVQITIAEPALPAHLAHGDLMPDEYGDCP
jgi:hypothetical protein